MMSGSTEHAAHPPNARAAGALEGIRVIDLSRVLAGPLCTQMLADQGANVIKGEPPGGDETRTLGPPGNAEGDAAYFTAVNRGKRAIGLTCRWQAGATSCCACWRTPTSWSRTSSPARWPGGGWITRRTSSRAFRS
ncbi:hypothetical protein G6F65_019219 [Rhizopus arrhizus]|nr:hypothetical protein G6F65_019219 [Rhizopus arrhizus]